jgi:hypothetical protein
MRKKYGPLAAAMAKDSPARGARAKSKGGKGGSKARRRSSVTTKEAEEDEPAALDAAPPSQSQPVRLTARQAARQAMQTAAAMAEAEATARTEREHMSRRPTSRKRKRSLSGLDVARLVAPATGMLHGGNGIDASLFGSSPFGPCAPIGRDGESPFAASRLLASPFQLRGGVLHSQHGGTAFDGAAFADFLDSDLVSPGMVAQLGNNLSPTLAGLMNMPPLGGGAAGGAAAGGPGASPLFGPSPFGALPPGFTGMTPAAGGVGGIIRRRSNRITPSSAGVRGFGGPRQGMRTGSMMPPPPPHAGIASVAPLSTGAIAATVSAMLATAGDGDPSPPSPFDEELARALFVSPSPAGPQFATPGTGSRRGGRSAHGGLQALHTPMGQVSPNPRGAPATFYMPPPPAADALGDAAAKPSLQRTNARLSQMFRPHAARRGALKVASPPRRAAAAVVAPDEEIGALDALHVMRRIDSSGALVPDDGSAPAARTTPDGKRVSPLRVAGVADMLRNRTEVGVGAGSPGGKAGARPRTLLDGTAAKRDSSEPTAAVALMQLTPGAAARAGRVM